MAKGHYHVAKDYDAPATPDDNSFKLCICTMLTLIALAVVILFFLWPWKYRQGPYNAAMEKYYRDQPTQKVSTEVTATKRPTEASNTTAFITLTTSSQAQNKTLFQSTEATNTGVSTTIAQPAGAQNTTLFQSTEVTNTGVSTTTVPPVGAQNTTLFQSSVTTNTGVSTTTVPPAVAQNTTMFQSTEAKNTGSSSTTVPPVGAQNTTLFQSTEATNTGVSTTTVPPVAAQNTTLFQLTEATHTGVSTTTVPPVGAQNTTLFQSTEATNTGIPTTTISPVEAHNTTLFQPTEAINAGVSTTTVPPFGAQNTTMFQATEAINIGVSTTTVPPVGVQNTTLFQSTEATNTDVSITTVPPVGAQNTTLFQSTEATNTGVSTTVPPVVTLFQSTEATNTGVPTTTVSPVEAYNTTLFHSTEATNTGVSTTVPPVEAQNTTLFQSTEATNTGVSTTTVSPVEAHNTTLFQSTEATNTGVSTMVPPVGAQNTTMFQSTEATNTGVSTTTVQSTEATNTGVSTTTVQSTEATNTGISITTVPPVAAQNTTLFQSTEATNTGVPTTTISPVEAHNTTLFQSTEATNTGVSTTVPPVGAQNTTLFQSTEATNTGVSTTTVQSTEATNTGVSITTVPPVAAQNTTLFQSTEAKNTGVSTTTVQSTEATNTGVSITTVPPVAAQNTTLFQSTEATNTGVPTTTISPVEAHNTTLFQSTEESNTALFTSTEATDTEVYTTTEVPNDAVFTTTTHKPIGVTTGAILAENEDLCNQTECKVIASHMLSLIDHRVSACKDFYVYACGGLRASKTLIEENPSVDVISRVTRQLKSVTKSSPTSYQRLKDFYKSCITYDEKVPMQKRKEQAKEIYNEFKRAVNAEKNEVLTYYLVNLFSRGSAPLFDIQLDVDVTDATKLAIVLTKPKLFSSFFQTAADNFKHCHHSSEDSINLDIEITFNKYINCKDNHSKYINNVHKALEELENDTLIAKDIWDMRVAVESSILNLLTHLPKEGEIRETIISKTFKDYTVNELQMKYTAVKWNILFRELFGREVSEDTKVQLYFEEFFNNMFKSPNVKELQTALLAVFAHKLYTDLVLTRNPCDREHYCFEVAGNLMPETVSNVYLNSFTKSERENIYKEAKEIFTRLISTMQDDVTHEDSSWLDKNSQNSVIQKLENMTFVEPYEFTDIDSNMNNKITLNNMQYLLNAVKLTKMRMKQYFSMYDLNPRNPKVTWLLFAKSFSPDVAYIHNINTLVVPWTRLVPLNVDNIPKYVKMAKTGVVIGQGIGSAFTNIGLLFDISGQRRSFLSDKSQTHQVFTDTMLWSCDHNLPYPITYIDEGKQYSIPQREVRLTQHSRLSDITGVNTVLETMQKSGDFNTKLPWGNFSPMETFFLLLAQEYCSKKGIPEIFQALYEDDVLPSIFRIQYIFANLKEFTETFKCPEGATMNSFVKCPPFPKFQKHIRPARDVNSQSGSSVSPKSESVDFSESSIPVYSTINQDNSVQPKTVDSSTTDPHHQETTLNKDYTGENSSSPSDSYISTTEEEPGYSLSFDLN